MMRPQHAHGTNRRYGAGCRCVPCRAAHSRYVSERRREHAAGIRRRVPADEAREYVATLVALGASRAAIATAAGLSVQTVSEIARGRVATVYASTADRILGVTLSDLSGRHVIPNTTAREILRALQAAGFTRAEVARMTGRAYASLGEARSSRIRVSTERRIVALYRLLARQGRVPYRLELERGAGS